MRGIVFGSTIDRAKTKMQKIIEDYQMMKIAPVRIINRRDGITAEFSNGDYWTTFRASESCRGRRCNVAYIDIKINQDIITDVLRPLVTLRPFQAEHYFDIWEEDDLDELLVDSSR